MTDPFLLSSVLVGVCGIIGLFVAAALKRRPMPQLAEAVVVFLSGAGIIAGVKVCRLSLLPTNLQALENERTYIFLAGLAVIWVSVDTVLRIISRDASTTIADISKDAKAE